MTGKGSGPSTRPDRILALLFVGVLMGALDIAIIGPALPAIREAFGIDERAAAWLISIYVLANLIGTPLMAKLSDRFGRRRVYAADVAIFGVGSIMVAAAPTFEMVLAGRAVQGLGAGGIFPVASAVIGDVFPPDRRGSALGLMGAVFGIAFLLGPLIGGVLLLLGWQWLFLVNVPIAAAVVIGALVILPPGGAAEPRPLDWAGMAVIAVALTAFALGLNRLDAAGLLASLASTRVWPFLLLAVALGILFPFVERRAADPVIRPGLFRSRQVALASALCVGAGITEAAVVFVPALLVEAFGVRPSTAAFMLFPIVIALVVGAPLFGRMVDRSGSRRVVVISTVLAGLGMGLVSAMPTVVTAFYAAALAVGLGLAGLLGSSLRYVMLSEAPPRDRGVAQGVLTVFISVGRLSGAAVLGAIIASRGRDVNAFGDAFLMVAVLMAMLTVLALGLRSRASELRHASRLAGRAG